MKENLTEKIMNFFVLLDYSLCYSEILQDLTSFFFFKYNCLDISLNLKN